jgi:23S rRNA (guanosine2251-2'-O)-methyltransferase
LFKARILTCEHLDDALKTAQSKGFSIYGLATENSSNINDVEFTQPNILVLGNESEGISPAIAQLCHQNVCIPMRNKVESLNVAVVAGVLSFMDLFRK